MLNPILHLFREGRTWMLSRKISEDGQCRRATLVFLAGGLDVETALKRARAERPGYEIRVRRLACPSSLH
jgi:hypothetical protein